MAYIISIFLSSSIQVDTLVLCLISNEERADKTNGN